MNRETPPSPRLSRICPQCEYDLTGLPDKCNCPECGQEIDAGLRSIKVCLGVGLPTPLALGFWVGGAALLVLVVAPIGYFFGSTWFAGCIAFFGLTGFGMEAVRAWRRLRDSVRSGYVGTLHSSPRRVSVRYMTFWSTEWSEVAQIRFTHSWFFQWKLVVEGHGKSAFRQRRLLTVFLPYSRRTAAHVRNTLRRHHRAWRKSQSDAECATAVQQ
jgi:hypothetical protein